MSKAEEYIGRYPLLDFRGGVWREIARYVRRDAPDAETVVELGAGYCDFINAFPAPCKIALDLNPEMAEHAGTDVDFRAEDAISMEGIAPGTVDLVFASNFLEHLDRVEIDRMLDSVVRSLKPGGKLILLQPNYARCGDKYFEDETHKTVFSDETLAQVVLDHSFRIEKIHPGLLPLTMKSRLPKAPVLVRMYLASPIKPLGAQMYLVATRR